MAVETLRLAELIAAGLQLVPAASKVRRRSACTGERKREREREGEERTAKDEARRPWPSSLGPPPLALCDARSLCKRATAGGRCCAGQLCSAPEQSKDRRTARPAALPLSPSSRLALFACQIIVEVARGGDLRATDKAEDGAQTSSDPSAFEDPQTVADRR